MSLPLEAGLRARFLRRYKRFFADVETDDGRELTVHCADPGSMRGFLRPGAAVRCSTSDDPRRKLRHTLEMMRVGRVWVGLHPGRANALVARAFEAGAIPDLAGYAEVRREVTVPDVAGESKRSRLDFRLDGGGRDRRPAWVEVKSVTLAEDGVALFPDSVTLRGRRHVETLARLRRKNARAALLFVVQRADCSCVAPADRIDPAYGKSLRAAAKAGVEVLAVSVRVTARAMTLEEPLPVVL